MGRSLCFSAVTTLVLTANVLLEGPVARRISLRCPPWYGTVRANEAYARFGRSSATVSDLQVITAYSTVAPQASAGVAPQSFRCWAAWRDARRIPPGRLAAGLRVAYSRLKLR